MQQSESQRFQTQVYLPLHYSHHASYSHLKLCLPKEFCSRPYLTEIIQLSRETDGNYMCDYRCIIYSLHTLCSVFNHPSIHYLYILSHCVTGNLSLIPQDSGHKEGYTLKRMSVYYKAQLHILNCLQCANRCVKDAISLQHTFWTVGKETQ